MKLTAFLLVAPALLAAALPTGDVLSEIEKREASPIAEAEPLYYSRSILCDFKFKVPRKRKQPFQIALADYNFFTVKRAGYKPTAEKREALPEAEAEAEPLYYSL
jgi:hypothetical protein